MQRYRKPVSDHVVGYGNRCDQAHGWVMGKDGEVALMKPKEEEGK